jgi:hypothetical protein
MYAGTSTYSRACRRIDVVIEQYAAVQLNKGFRH